MKNRLIYWTLLGLMIIFCVPNLVLAQDSASFAVSCSIPAVPGLNAPPLGEKPEAVTKNVASQQEAKINNQASEQANTIIQKETYKKIVLADGRVSSLTTQTVYSR